MCGIAGKITFRNTRVSMHELQKMTNSIIHRGPDGEGQWINEESNIGLGHRRLSIIDLSEKASQPMHSSNGRFVITYNGEIYNYIELRSELKKKGYEFFTESDTEVLIAGYQEFGKLFLNKIDGMFAFGIWDKENQELFCARDRFGEKPFFYFLDNEKFVFASEMKAIFASGIPKFINNQMLYLYLTYDVVENPNNKSQTFYENIIHLPASHCMKVSVNGKIKVKKYWDIDTESISDISFEDAKFKFKSLFEESVQLRMRSDVSVGSSLSGGLDSSSILCTILDLFPRNRFNTFTARFKNKDFDEGKYIEKLHKHVNFISHSCYPSSKLMIDELDKIFYHQEEPFGSSSIINQWEVMKLAKENNTVVLLDGQGADEIIGGYFKYFLPYLYETKKNEKEKYYEEKVAIQNHLGIQKYFNKKEKLRMMAPKLYDNVTDILRSKITNNIGHDLNDEFKNTFRYYPQPFHRDNNLNDFLYNDVFKYGLGKLLRFSDRNSMAHSREVRLPYLSYKLVEFIFSLPAHFKIQNGWTKFILRKSMEDVVPLSIVYRKDKMGFQAPDSWLQEKHFKELIENSISVLKEHRVIKHSNVSNYWKYLMVSKILIS